MLHISATASEIRGTLSTSVQTSSETCGSTGRGGGAEDEEGDREGEREGRWSGSPARRTLFSSLLAPPPPLCVSCRCDPWPQSTYEDRYDRNGDGNYGYEDQQRFLPIFNRNRRRRRRGRCPFETNVACPKAAAVGFGQHLLLGIVPMVSVPISGVPRGPPGALEKHRKPPKTSESLRRKIGERSTKTAGELWADIGTPEMGTETMGTMPNSKCCPKPTAAAVGRATLCHK